MRGQKSGVSSVEYYQITVSLTLKRIRHFAKYQVRLLFSLLLTLHVKYIRYSVIPVFCLDLISESVYCLCVSLMSFVQYSQIGTLMVGNADMMNSKRLIRLYAL